MLAFTCKSNLKTNIEQRPTSVWKTFFVHTPGNAFLKIFVPHFLPHSLNNQLLIYKDGVLDCFFFLSPERKDQMRAECLCTLCTNMVYFCRVPSDLTSAFSCTDCFSLAKGNDLIWFHVGLPVRWHEELRFSVVIRCQLTLDCLFTVDTLTLARAVRYALNMAV